MNSHPHALSTCKSGGRSFLSRPSIAGTLLAAAGLISGVSSVEAANFTWAAAPSTANWNLAGNWVGGLPAATGSLFFGTSNTTVLNNDVAAGTVFNGVTFNAGASAFNITGNSINLAGNVTNSSTTAQVLNLATTITKATTFTTTQGGGDLTIGSLAGGFSITKAGGGTLTLLGANTYTGSTTINVGSITYGSASTAAVTQSLTSLAVAAGNDANVTSVFGTGGGNSSLTFTSNATGVPAAGSTVNYVVSGGSNGTTNQIRLTGSTAAGFVNKNSYFNGADYAYMDGVGTFVRAPVYGTDSGFVNAGSSLTASAHNQITSSITGQGAVTTLTLKFSGAGAVDLGLTGALTLGTAASTASEGGLLRSGGGSTTISGGSITTGSGAAYVFRTDTASDSMTISSPILANGTNTLTKSGAGTLTLSGANTYTGTTFADGGTLNMSGTFATSLLSVNNPGATVNVSGTNALTGSTAVTIGTNGGIVNYSSSNNNTGVTTLNGGTAIVSASGAFGTGGVSINAATIQTSGGTPLTFSNVITSSGNGPWNVNGNTDVTFNGVLNIAGANQINVNNTGATNFAGGINLASTVPTGNRTTTLAGSGAITVGGNIVDGFTGGTPNNALIYSGTNTLTLNGANTFTGPLAITSGTVKIGSGTALGFGGTDTITNAASIVGTTTLATGTTLDLNAQSVNEPIVLNGGSLVNNSGTAATINNGVAGIALGIGGSTGTGFTPGSSVTFTGGGGTGAAATINSIGYAVGSFGISSGGTGYAVGNTFTIAGPGSTGAKIQVTSVDAFGAITGYLVNPGTSSPTGIATTVAPGTVAVGASGASFSIAPTPVYQISGITVTNAGTGYTSAPTLSSAGGTITDTPALSQVTLGAASTVGGSGNIAVNAVVNGGSSLTKVGTGTVSLNGVNTYAGTTTVTGGSLLVNGAHSTGGNYIVNAAGILGGNGTIAPTGANTVAISGALAPGDSTAALPSGQTGTLTINSTGVNFANGSAFNVQIGGPSAGAFDQLALTNTGATNITLTGTVTLNLTWVGGTPLSSDSYEIVNRAGSGTWGGFFANAGEGSTVTFTNGYTGTITYLGGDGNDVIISNIQLVSVPEPQSVALGVVGLLGMIIFVRNRRRSSVA